MFTENWAKLEKVKQSKKKERNVFGTSGIEKKKNNKILKKLIKSEKK